MARGSSYGVSQGGAMIGKDISIADAGQGEVNCKEVGFEISLHHRFVALLTFD